MDAPMDANMILVFDKPPIQSPLYFEWTDERNGIFHSDPNFWLESSVFLIHGCLYFYLSPSKNTDCNIYWWLPVRWMFHNHITLWRPEGWWIWGGASAYDMDVPSFWSTLSVKISLPGIMVLVDDMYTKSNRKTRPKHLILFF